MTKELSSRRWHLLLAVAVTFLFGPANDVSAHPGHDSGKVSAKAREQARDESSSYLNVIVRFLGAPGNSEEHLIKSLGGSVYRRHRPSSRWMSVRIPRGALEALGKNPNIEFVAADPPMTPALDVALQAADAPSSAAPESALKGAGITIAEVDSGVAQHPGIQTLVASVDFVGTLDPTYSPAGSVDPYGHGTHVAGILVGNGSDSYQGQLAGVAPQANLVSVRVLDGNGGGSASTVLSGLQWILANKDTFGIRVVNLSLGHPVYESAAQDPLVQEVEALWNAGIVVVCSAGNEGRSGDGTITSPCNSRKVITVGALNDQGTPQTSDDTITTYSSRGPTLFDLVAKPDLLAPGNKIVSARSAGSYLDNLLPDRRVAGDPAQPTDVQYFQLSGTSMAAPMVAGAAALMLQQDPTLNPGTVKARLMLSAQKASVGSPFAVGAGALDILGALHATGSVSDAPSPLSSADATTGLMTFENPGVLWGNLSFSLMSLWSSAVVWTDPTQWNQPYVSSSGVVLPDTTVSPYSLIFPSPTVSPEATLWPDSTLWSEAVIWPDGPQDVAVDSMSLVVDDP